MPLPLHLLTSPPPPITVNDSKNEKKNSLSQSGGRVNLEGKNPLKVESTKQKQKKKRSMSHRQCCRRMLLLLLYSRVVERGELINKLLVGQN